MERLRSHGQSRRNTNARVSRRGACTVLVLSPHADAPLPRGNVQINAKYRKVYSLRSTRKRERERERKRETRLARFALFVLSFMCSPALFNNTEADKYFAVGFRPCRPSRAASCVKSRKISHATRVNRAGRIVLDCPGPSMSRTKTAATSIGTNATREQRAREFRREN